MEDLRRGAVARVAFAQRLDALEHVARLPGDDAWIAERLEHDATRPLELHEAAEATPDLGGLERHGRDADAIETVVGSASSRTRRIVNNGT